MQPLKIGLLTPYSGIYPYYSAHLATGWLVGMGLDPARQKTISFVPEYTQQGSPSATMQAARKLLFFDRVDVLSGLISYKAMGELTPLVENDGKPAFFFDMGELIPHFPFLSPSVFFASHQLWQSEYALGYWARRKFGDGGHMVMPIYESGYHLHSSFYQGAAAAGGSELIMTILPDTNTNRDNIQLDDFFKALEITVPPYVHAIFSGNMGNRFLTEWVQRGYHRKIPLLINETMAYDDILQDVQHIDMEIYSSMMWNRNNELKENQVFVKKFETIAKQPANIFALMGYEAGLIWREVLPLAQKRDWAAVKTQLQNGSIKGPRGEKNFFPLSGFSIPDTDILKISITNNKIHKLIIDQGKGMHFNAPVFETIHRESVSGWLNPFLCV